jgi:hypothetical protein
MVEWIIFVGLSDFYKEVEKDDSIERRKKKKKVIEWQKSDSLYIIPSSQKVGPSPKSPAQHGNPKSKTFCFPWFGLSCWFQHAPRFTRGMLRKWSRSVTTFSRGDRHFVHGAKARR